MLWRDPGARRVGRRSHRVDLGSLKVRGAIPLSYYMRVEIESVV